MGNENTFVHVLAYLRPSSASWSTHGPEEGLEHAEMLMVCSLPILHRTFTKKFRGWEASCILVVIKFMSFDSQSVLQPVVSKPVFIWDLLAYSSIIMQLVIFVVSIPYNKWSKLTDQVHERQGNDGIYKQNDRQFIIHFGIDLWQWHSPVQMTLTVIMMEAL